MPGPPKIVGHDGNHAVGQWGSIVVAVWRYVAVADAAKRVQRVFKAAQEDGVPAGHIGVIEPECEVPGSDVRAVFERMMKDTRRGMDGAALVLEGGGFAASTARAVITGLTLVARPPVPIKTYAEVTPAADWLIPYLVQHGAQLGPAKELIEFVARLRETIPRRAQPARVAPVTGQS